jgi:hypothetical protein
MQADFTISTKIRMWGGGGLASPLCVFLLCGVYTTSEAGGPVCTVLTAVSSICSRICHEKIKLQFCSLETFAILKHALVHMYNLHCVSNKYWVTADVNNIQYMSAELKGRDDISSDSA